MTRDLMALSRKLHDIIDMFKLTQSVSEPTHNQGHLLDLVFSKQSDNILTSTKLHHGHLTTQPSCANLMYLYLYKNLKLSRTDASKRLTPAPLNKISLTLSHKSVLSVTTTTISVLSLTSMPLSAVAQSVQGRRRPGSAVLQSSSLS